MRYIVADIHGCYAEFRELLAKINFSDSDELYVLGDAMDRGAEPIKVLQDMMARPNVFYILGNHDYAALAVLPKLTEEITVKDHLKLADSLRNSERTEKTVRSEFQPCGSDVGRQEREEQLKR